MIDTTVKCNLIAHLLYKNPEVKAEMRDSPDIIVTEQPHCEQCYAISCTWMPEPYTADVDDTIVYLFLCDDCAQNNSNDI